MSLDKILGSGSINISADLYIGNATLSHQANGATQLYRVNLFVGGDMTVDTDGWINASGSGYTAGNGPGSTGQASGGSYGGRGYSSQTPGPTYGSPTEPIDLGSGSGTSAGNAGVGGGAVFLNVTGTFMLNGTIVANGTNGPGASYQDQGSGGSIWILANEFLGGGSISAGGCVPGSGRCGGGGRIALSSLSGMSFDSISLEAFGGGSYSGSAGTIFTKVPGQVYGTLTIDNNGKTNTFQTDVPKNARWIFDSINVSNYGYLNLSDSSNVTVTKVLGENPNSKISVTSGAGFFVPSDFDIYIPNDHCFKRLFLNPLIYSFYGHLNYTDVINITPQTRDTFPTSGIFRNCETNNEEVYGVEVTGEDTGILHHIQLTGEQAVNQDPNFFKKVFCINNNEFNWYTNNGTRYGAPYTSLEQVPVYSR